MSFSLRSSRFPQLEPLTDSSSPSSSSLALAEHTHYAAASAFLRLIRAKAPISEAEDELASFQKALESERGLSAAEADKVKRDLAVQTVLNVGSRSFSHFLNALERYLTLLRALTSSAPGPPHDRRRLLAPPPAVPPHRPRQAPPVPPRRHARRHGVGVRARRRAARREDQDVERHRPVADAPGHAAHGPVPRRLGEGEARGPQARGRGARRRGRRRGARC